MFEQVKDLKKQYQIIPAKSKEFDGDGGVIISALQEKMRPYRLLIDTRPVHTIVTGMARSGKGEAFVFPMIDVQSRAKNKPSLVINDPKGELANASYDTLVARGYDVYIVNLNHQKEINLDLNDVGFGDKPIALFLISSNYDRSISMLASKFISDLYRANMEKTQIDPSGKTKRLIHYLLDDLGDMPPIEDMPKMVAIGACRGFRFHLIFNTISQLKNLYGDDADTIIGNCSNQIYFYTPDSSTIAGLTCGEVMYLKDGESIVVRTKMQQGNSTSTKPIFNRGITALKFRYQYLAEDFDNTTRKGVHRK